MRDRILDYILENRVNTTEVADALGKKGVIPHVLPVNQGMFRAGKVKCVFAANESNYTVHEQVEKVDKDSVVIIFTHNCNDRSIIGELVAKYVLLYQRATSIVVDGSVRDVAALRRERFAVWSKGVSPIGCFNRPAEPFPSDLRDNILARYDDGIAVCDDGGVVVIPPSQLTMDMLQRLERIERQEDVWFFCLDALKWNTKRIVCDKAYLNDMEELPEVFKSKVSELAKPLDNE
jgi:regulator of RNase E activity RraA